MENSWAFLAHLHSLAGYEAFISQCHGFQILFVFNFYLVLSFWWLAHNKCVYACRPAITLIYPLYVQSTLIFLFSHAYSLPWLPPDLCVVFPCIRLASICAIEGSSKVEDEQWLAYWIIYSFLTLMEMLAEPILYWYAFFLSFTIYNILFVLISSNMINCIMWSFSLLLGVWRIPIWYDVKVALVAWLVLPQFRGASLIYDRFVREQLRKYGAKLGASTHHWRWSPD